jgi:hypothetical protein
MNVSSPLPCGCPLMALLATLQQLRGNIHCRKQETANTDVALEGWADGCCTVLDAACALGGWCGGGGAEAITMEHLLLMMKDRDGEAASSRQMQ